MGYVDYTFWGRLCHGGVFFITPRKSNAVYDVVEEREAPKNRHVLSDCVIRLTGIDAQEKCPFELLKIEVWDPEEERVLVFLTNKRMNLFTYRDLWSWLNAPF